MPKVCDCANRQPEGSVSEKCYYCGKALPPKARVSTSPAYGYDADGSYVSMPIEDEDDD